MDRAQSFEPPRPLIDTFGRKISYLRLSVTDRCDLRCVYCMKARPDFLPKSELLSLEELTVLCDAFIRRGVRKIRITGGEPLVRRDVVSLIEALGTRLPATGLEEICLTTNATQMPRFAERLARAGVRRVNISLDTLDANVFARLTRGGRLSDTLAGIEAAAAAGLQVKINAVALKGGNDTTMPDMIRWAHDRGFDISLIEIMPMGDVEASREDQFLPLDRVRRDLETRWTLTDISDRTGGPARYVRIAETGGRLGFITPLTSNFCQGCNRVRLTCTGQLHLCLGRESEFDLRAAVRSGGADAVDELLDAAMRAKPEAHDFHVSRLAEPAVGRNMAHTGG